MIWFYRLIYLPVFLLAFPLYYLPRMLRRGGYGEDFGQRLGFVPRLPAKDPARRRIWIQAVSVGELLAIGPVLKALAADPRNEVLLTTTTSTGYVQARNLYPGLTRIIGLFPFDFILCAWTAWRRFDPDLVVLMESELWPEHIRQAKRRGVPVALVNGRLSDKSFDRFRMTPFFHDIFLGGVDLILASTDQDAERFRFLGCPESTVVRSGNLKFDVDIQPRLDKTGIEALRSECGFPTDRDTLVLLGSSTWPGEETVLLESFRKLHQENPLVRLLLVPRHAERRQEIATLLDASGLAWHQRSKTPKAAPGTLVYLADTTGELKKFTQVADFIFIGKSLPPNNGGQTPIEAAACAKPIVAGPAMGNFREAVAGMRKADAILVGEDAAQIHAHLATLATNPDRRATLGKNAEAWHATNKGALDKVMDQISHLLGP